MKSQVCGIPGTQSTLREYVLTHLKKRRKI